MMNIKAAKRAHIWNEANVMTTNVIMSCVAVHEFIYGTASYFYDPGKALVKHRI